MTRDWGRATDKPEPGRSDTIVRHPTTLMGNLLMKMTYNQLSRMARFGRDTDA